MSLACSSADYHLCVRWARVVGRYLDEIQAERSQGKLPQRGYCEDGWGNGVAHRVVEAGDLQQLQLLQQRQRAEIARHHPV